MPYRPRILVMQARFPTRLWQVLIGTWLAVPLAFAQPVDLRDPAFVTPRLPWGHADLQGVWDRRTITPLERPERFAGVAYLSEEQAREYERLSSERDDGRPLDEPRAGLSVHDPDDLDYGSRVLATRQTSLVVDPPDGRIPAYTEEARRRTEMARRELEGRGTADSYEDRSLQERCITWGVPAGMLPQPYNNNIQIVQTPGTVMIMNEMIHDIRIVPLDGRPHVPDSIRQWHGDPRGHWEGDTLVVESTNFSPKTSFRRASDKLRLVERYTRVADHMLLYEFTVEDSSTWVGPWTVSFPMTQTDQPIYEYACHEGNYGLLNILRVARALEKQAAEQAQSGN